VLSHHTINGQIFRRDSYFLCYTEGGCSHNSLRDRAESQPLTSRLPVDFVLTSTPETTGNMSIEKESKPLCRATHSSRVATINFLQCLLASLSLVVLLALSAQNVSFRRRGFTVRDDEIDTRTNVEPEEKSPDPLVLGPVDVNATSQSEDKVFLRRSDFPPEPPSPYEIRFPGWKRPEWASKPRFFQQQPIPEDKRLCFVHIGKTAGSTVGCALGFQLHCDGSAKYPMGLLPKYTSHTNHNEVNDCPDDVAYYLFVVRDPLERLRSAYVYDRPGTFRQQPLLYRDCFYFLNDLAEQGLAKSGNASAVCKERAYNAVHGMERRFGRHLFFNYEYYTKQALGDDRSKQVVVIRNPHLQEDWNSIESLLGGSPRTAAFPVRNKGQNKESGDDYMSEMSRVLLCNALCEEIQLYKSLLERAVNLMPMQVATSLQELSLSCPNEAAAASCPDSSKTKLGEAA
jgi:hypothetical protein